MCFVFILLMFLNFALIPLHFQPAQFASYSIIKISLLMVLKRMVFSEVPYLSVKANITQEGRAGGGHFGRNIGADVGCNYL